MKNQFFIAALVASAATTFTACSNTKKASCSGDVICTMMFAAVTVDVKDATGAPVALDSVVTIREDKAGRFTPQDNSIQGGYVILDDSYLNKMKMETGKFRFKGYKVGKVVVDEPYTISADCCHVKLENGKKEITVM